MQSSRLGSTVRAVIRAASLILASSHPAAAQDTLGVYQVRATVTVCLNIRLEPDAESDVVRCIVPGARVTADSAVPFWRRVTLANGERGWGAKRFLEPLAGATPLVAVVPDSAADDAAPDRWLEIHIVDVGQGDGIWIATPDDGQPGNGRYEGYNVIIDGGPNGTDATNAMLAYLLDHAHEEAAVDALIVTHPHVDHFPGAIGILKHFDVRAYYDPGYPKQGEAYPEFITRVRGERVDGQRIPINRGPLDELGTLDWGSELSAEFLHSYPGTSGGLGRGSTLENNASLVLRLQYGEHVFLFMGDAEGKDRSQGPETARYVERMLLDNHEATHLKATVLKLAHHGSETSSTLPFIEAVDPEVIIVSSGRKSFSGTFLPDASTLARYCTHNSNTLTYRTDRNDHRRGPPAPASAAVDGDHIVIRTNGRTLQIIAYDNGQELAASAARCP